MAKRLTDPLKWEDEWFSELSVVMKLVWIYLCDRCDHAGIFKPNIKLLNFRIGCRVSKEKILKSMNNGKERLRVLESTKWFLTDFIDFQQPRGLQRNNNCHLSILKLLEKNNIDVSPWLGAGVPLTMGPGNSNSKGKGNIKKGGCGGKTSRHTYGNYSHVQLSDEEYSKLQGKFGPDGADEWITKVDEGIELKGYVYKNHYLAILKWARDERLKPKEKSTKDIIRAALAKRAAREAEEGDNRGEQENGAVPGALRGELREDAVR